MTASIACGAPGISPRTARWSAHGDGPARSRAGTTQVFFEPLRRRSTASRFIAAAAPEQGGWVSRSFGRKQPGTTVLLAFAHFGCHRAAHAHHLHEVTRRWPLNPRFREAPAPGRDRRRAERASARMRSSTTTASASSTRSATSTPRRAARPGCIARGVRHLSRLTLTIAGLRPLLLSATSARRQRAAQRQSHQSRRARRGRPHRCCRAARCTSRARASSGPACATR